MKRWMATCAFAAAIAATAHAQDSTVTTRTQVKADDAKAITATGCLVPGLAPGAFALRGGITARGEEVTSKTQTKTEVDSDEARVRTAPGNDPEAWLNLLREAEAKAAAALQRLVIASLSLSGGRIIS